MVRDVHLHSPATIGGVDEQVSRRVVLRVAVGTVDVLRQGVVQVYVVDLRYIGGVTVADASGCGYIVRPGSREVGDYL